MFHSLTWEKCCAALLIYTQFMTKSVVVGSACIYQYVSVAVLYSKLGGLIQPASVWFWQCPWAGKTQVNTEFTLSGDILHKQYGISSVNAELPALPQNSSFVPSSAMCNTTPRTSEAERFACPNSSSSPSTPCWTPSGSHQKRTAVSRTLLGRAESRMVALSWVAAIAAAAGMLRRRAWWN